MGVEPISTDRFGTRVPEFGHRCPADGRFSVQTRLLCEFFVPEWLRQNFKFQILEVDRELWTRYFLADLHQASCSNRLPLTNPNQSKHFEMTWRPIPDTATVGTAGHWRAGLSA